MNIADVTVDYNRYEGRDMIDVMFQRQGDLMDLYLIPTIDLDVPADQQILRAMAWNVVEELAEAMDVVQTTKHALHILDEVADMTHFYLELLIMSGLSSDDYLTTLGFKTTQELLEREHQLGPLENPTPNITLKNFVVTLALAINVLKNRHWRKTNLKTDSRKYYAALLQTVPHFYRFYRDIGLDTETLIDGYLRKNEVNLFRIRSKY